MSQRSDWLFLLAAAFLCGALGYGSVMPVTTYVTARGVYLTDPAVAGQLGVVLLADSAAAARIRPGQTVDILPTATQGVGTKGEVVTLEQTPAPADILAAARSDDRLAVLVNGPEPLHEVRVRLSPPVPVAAGTLCTARIAVRTVPAVALVLPFLGPDVATTANGS